MKKTVLILIGTVVLLAVLIGGAYRYLWSIRQTPEQVRETTKAVRKEFRAAPPPQDVTQERPWPTI